LNNLKPGVYFGYVFDPRPVWFVVEQHSNANWVIKNNANFVNKNWFQTESMFNVNFVILHPTFVGFKGPP